MSRMDAIRAQLAALNPVQLQLLDDSAAHAGHAGASSGGHFRLRIVSTDFAGKNTIARHRMVYSALQNLMQDGIHALTITALTPEESNSL